LISGSGTSVTLRCLYSDNNSAFIKISPTPNPLFGNVALQGER
jgi:hypothetical protein